MATTDHIELIHKHLAGLLDSGEKQQLDDWIARSSDNEKTFREIEDIWKGAELAAKHLQKEDWSSNTDLALERVQARLGMKKAGPTSSPHAKQVPVNKLLRIAATILLLIVAGLWWNSTRKVHAITVVATDLQEVALPDGSVVYLREGSEMTYASRFQGVERLIELKGEAYFDVEHEATKPFRVETPVGDIEVLGTTFNVNTKTNGQLVVHCKTGKVRVSGPSLEDHVVLEAAEEVTVYPNDPKSTKSQTFGENYLSWKTGVLNFAETPVQKVISDLANHFGVRIIVENDLIYRCHFESNMENQTLLESLEELKIGLQVNISRSAKKTYVVEGSGICN